jgi:4-hydroxy-3-polyprenylbenzoate decarboxylase
VVADWPRSASPDLGRIDVPVFLRHEMTAFQLALRRQGPILRFDTHDGPAIPVIGNLFGTRDRVALSARFTVLRHAPVQQEDLPGLDALPVQTPWPGDRGPLITWPVVLTRPQGSEDLADYNLGVYRAQVVEPDRLIPLTPLWPTSPPNCPARPASFARPISAFAAAAT